MLQFVALLLVVFTPTYTPFGYSFAIKRTPTGVFFYWSRDLKSEARTGRTFKDSNC